MDYNVLLYSLQPWEIYQIQTPLSTLQMLWKIWDVFLKHHWFNFRLPELLDHFAKTLERVVFHQLSPFLTQNILLDNSQSGFRSATKLRRPCSRLLKLWDWQEEPPNPQFSSCWICLLLTVNHQEEHLRNSASSLTSQWVLQGVVRCLRPNI